jgi:hypothetical protein
MEKMPRSAATFVIGVASPENSSGMRILRRL